MRSALGSTAVTGGIMTLALVLAGPIAGKGSYAGESRLVDEPAKKRGDVPVAR